MGVYNYNAFLQKAEARILRGILRTGTSRFSKLSKGLESVRGPRARVLGGVHLRLGLRTASLLSTGFRMAQVRGSKPTKVKGVMVGGAGSPLNPPPP